MIKKALIGLASLGLMAQAQAQTIVKEPFPTFVNGATQMSLPIMSSDMLALVRGPVTYKLPGTYYPSVATAPLALNNSTGTISIANATSSAFGVVKPDNSTITISSGIISAAASGINQLTGDATAGPGTGSQAITFATVNGNVGSFTCANVTVNAKGLTTAAANGSCGGSGAGLFAGVMSAVPTKSSTGFTNTPIGTGSPTASDASGSGIILVPGTVGGAAICKAAPVTPYNIKMLVAATGASTALEVGWSDGTKYQLGFVDPAVTGATTGHFLIFNFSAFNVPDGGAIYDQGWGINVAYTWLELVNSGSQVTWKISRTGADLDFLTMHSETISGAYLTNYNNVCLQASNGGNISLLSYVER